MTSLEDMIRSRADSGTFMMVSVWRAATGVYQATVAPDGNRSVTAYDRDPVAALSLALSAPIPELSDTLRYVNLNGAAPAPTDNQPRRRVRTPAPSTVRTRTR